MVYELMDPHCANNGELYTTPKSISPEEPSPVTLMCQTRCTLN